MTVTLEMHPQDAPKTWSQFIESSPKFSIALDGYVFGGPKFDLKGPRANFNHHEEVDRLATHSTCGQILMALRQGLLRAFRDNNGVRIIVWANDCDEDVCTSWFLLKNHHLCTSTMNPVLNRLVQMEDHLDATAGAYPYPADLSSLQALAWIFDPYRRARLSGELDKKGHDSYVSIITDVENRIMRHIIGQGETLPLDVRYDRLGGGRDWAMIREVGAQAKTGAFGDGIYAYASVRDRPNQGEEKRYTYTVGRMSPFIPFDLPRIFAALNAAESLEGASDRWGGGDTIGGSPRVGGSRLAPEDVTRIINEVISKES